MTLKEVLTVSRSAEKWVANGTYTVSKANISPGYFKDFIPSDPTQRSHVSTSYYYSPNELDKITAYAGEDGWEVRHV